jgi:importin-9
MAQSIEEINIYEYTYSS